MKSVFVALTPYHIFLSCAVALDGPKFSKNYLFVMSDFASAESFVEAIKGWGRSPFLEVRQLPGTYRKSILRRRLVVRENVSVINRFLQEIRGVNRVYVFNDSRAESQTTLRLAKRGSKQSVGIYIEDGANAYSSYVSRKRNLAKILLGKVFYGRWWEDIRISGTSKWVDEIKVLFPSLLRSELQDKRILPISKQVLLGLAKEEELFRDYFRRVGTSLDEVKAINAVLLVRHSDFLGDISGYRKQMSKVTSALQGLQIRVGVKYHPAEPLGDFLSLRGVENMILLPPSVAAESIFLFGEVGYVIGTLSTSLITGRWLLEKAKVVSVAPMVGHYDSNVLKVFGKLGILIAEDVERLRTVLGTH